MLPDNSVVVRVNRLSADSRSNMDGFALKYGCSGDTSADEQCRREPVILMTSNAMQAAACARHVRSVLQKVIDAVLRSKNGEAGYGMLRPFKVPSHLISKNRPVLAATDDVVWSNRLDQRYDVVVYRAIEPSRGVLVIRDGDLEVTRTNVALAYNAVVGPDASDVDLWCGIAIEAIDASKAPSQLLREALARVENERQAQITALAECKHGGEAYALALKTFRRPELSIEWLISPNVALASKTPAAIADEPDGLDRLREALRNVEKTFYPLAD
jgi:Protein of unknown function (DUF2384)